MLTPSGRITTIDSLRGIASLSVAWFHFTQANPVLTPGVVKATGRYGWLGVDIFFVISGFVIPYSLDRAGYRQRQFGKFLVKRIVRLDPPYFANFAFVLILAFIVPLVPGFHGPRPHFTTMQLLAHIAYLNSVLGKMWINPVYWSLGIEFQYYLLIGLIFPLLTTARAIIRRIAIAALLVPGFFVPQGALLFVHLPLFVAGILTFQFKTGRLSRWSFCTALTVATVVAAIGLGRVIAVTCAITSLVIAFVEIGGRILGWLGAISYSLYLMHVPIGGKIIDLGARFGHREPIPVLFLLAAIAGSILAAWILYRLVELPSQTLSSRFSYAAKSQNKERESVECVVAA